MADERPIIIKKIKKVSGHGHHGGAWKVAYADFVTAMMAFFLLLWLLNTTSQEQKEGISNYFAPTNVSFSTSGSGGVMGGKTLESEGAMPSDVSPLVNPTITDVAGIGTGKNDEAESDAEATPAELEKQEELRAEDENNFEKLEKSIRLAFSQDKDLQGLAENILLERTNEGLRIQLIDQDERPLFASGSREPMDYTRTLINKVGSMIADLPNQVSIAGHTDAHPFNQGLGYTNWELSSDRANVARRILISRKVREQRIASVEGKASREPLLKDKPFDAANRRISMTLLYRDASKPAEAPTSPIKNGVFR